MLLLERLVHVTTEHGTYGRIPLDDGQELTGIAQAHAIEPGTADGQWRMMQAHENRPVAEGLQRQLEARQLLRDGVVPLGQAGLDPSGRGLSRSAAAWLEAIAAGLRPRPGARLRLCPGPGRAPDGGPETASVPSTEGLVRDALVGAGGLPADRVLGCDAPASDASAGAPVQVSLEVTP